VISPLLELEFTLFRSENHGSFRYDLKNGEITLQNKSLNLQALQKQCLNISEKWSKGRKAL
jgi:hypothetical protein